MTLQVLSIRRPANHIFFHPPVRGWLSAIFLRPPPVSPHNPPPCSLGVKSKGATRSVAPFLYQPSATSFTHGERSLAPSIPSRVRERRQQRQHSPLCPPLTLPRTGETPADPGGRGRPSLTLPRTGETTTVFITHFWVHVNPPAHGRDRYPWWPSNRPER